MTLDSILYDIKDKMNKSPAFKGIKVITAYENKIKPTRLNNPVIALGFDCINLDSQSIDESERSGEIKIFADIYVPQKSKAYNAQEIFVNICELMGCFNVLSVSAGRLAYDAQAQAFLLNAGLCFRDTVDFGGA